MKQILFITGTGTGVGKTLFTAHLLHHLRQKNHNTLALKPFCSGSRGDARLLESLQRGYLTLDQINPFYFPKPLAPWVAAPEKQQKLTLKSILSAIQEAKKRCDTLLIEGSGGIYVPLTEKLLVADLMAKLPCCAIVIARDGLGTINHTLLTVRSLQDAGVEVLAVVLMRVEKPDLSTKTNLETLRHFLPQTPIFALPFLGQNASKTTSIKNKSKKIQKTLDQIGERVNLMSFERETGRTGRKKQNK